MRHIEFNDGIAINGTFPDKEVIDLINEKIEFGFPLVIADPPYGNIVNSSWDKINTSDIEFCKWMIHWTNCIENLVAPGSALYVWGGIGKPLFRPFYRYLVSVEHETNYRLANHITWSKKRAYGVQHNYLFTREELAYLHLGEDIKKPRKFNVPLLDEKRGYAGYNIDYPAKSEFYRRTNVWTDVTEIFRGKVHETQKPSRVMEIPIEVHTSPGNYVLDPFAGSGTTAFAARKLGRKFVVVEEDNKIFDEMVLRLNT